MSAQKHADPPRDGLVRMIYPGIELREAPDGNSLGLLSGHFAVFNQWAEINSSWEGHFLERFAPGAFKKTFQEGTNKIRVLFQHGFDHQFGKKVLGPIALLREDAKGAYYEVPLLDTSYNRDLVPGLREGLYGASFRFRILRMDEDRHPGRSAYNPEGIPERTITEAAVAEFGPVTFPAYEGATAGVRSMTDDFPPERVGNPNRTYDRAVEFVGGACWAVHPQTLAIIQAIIGERASGYRPTPEEIAERISGHPSERETILDLNPEDGQTIENPVAVLDLYGVIVPKTAIIENSSGGGLVSVESFLAGFRAAMADPNVKAIVLNIDSPGGEVSLVPELAAEILEARDTKPIIAVANTWAASAAYWIASAATEVIATPSGEVGSIGVWIAHEDISAAMEMMGIDKTLISAGKYKVEGNPYEPLSEEAAAEMQRGVDSYYAMFLKAVAKGRGVKVAAVRSGFGQGRMVMATEALDEGMIDGVATLDETIARLTKQVSEPEPGRATTPKDEALPDDGAGADHSDGGSRESSRPAAVRDPDKTRSKEAPIMGDIEYRTVEEKQVRLREINASLEGLDSAHEGQALPDDEKAEWDALLTERAMHERDITEAEQRRAQIGESAKNERAIEPGATFRTSQKPDNPFDLTTIRSNSNDPERMGHELRDRARFVVDGLKSVPHERADLDQVKTHIDRMLETVDTKDGKLSRHLLVTGSPEYRAAFGKAISGRPLKSEEAALLERAASLTDASGGYAVPFMLDPTVIPTSDGALNPIRSIARKETIVGTDTWKGVSSAGVTASYGAEAAEASDDTPTLAQPEVAVEKAQVFVPFSIEIGSDWSAFQSEMATMFQDAKDTLEAEEFVTGLGSASNTPEGVVAGLDAGSVVDTAAATTFAVADVYSLKQALPARFRPNAKWMGEGSIYDLIRQFDTSGGADLWISNLALGLGDNPDGRLDERLLGKPAYESSFMDSTVADGKDILLYGDFGKGYLIVDRIGMTVELVQHLVGTNHRPTGQRGLYAYWRNAGVILVDNAFRLLNVKSS
jgi:HK97 family phage major capsid protein/HK97 family phage prohead protease